MAGQLSWVENALEREPPTMYVRTRALLAELRGDNVSAAQLYREVALSSQPVSSRALAAVRAFATSRGKVDCFSAVPSTLLSVPLRSVYEAYCTTRKTDLGGLDRREKADLVGGLPQPFETAQGVDSLDAVRLYIGFLTEAARILHEARDWSSALALDFRAYRFAQAIREPTTLGMTTGGIGACYMGLAEDSADEDRTTHLRTAEDWLRRATHGGPQSCGPFAWSLHTCNRGVVAAQLGRVDEGIALLESALPVLIEVFPNYAVCFHGDLALAYVDQFDVLHERACLGLAIHSLAMGWALADRLDDHDDVYFLERGQRAVDSRGLRRLV